MIFFFKSDGTLIKSAPETVYQGSAEAGKVYVVAPLNANMLVDVYYELPNGERWGAYLLENNGTVINNEELPDGWALWSTTLESAITQYAGTLKVQFGFYQSGTADKVPLITSQGVTITISKGVIRDLPSEPTADVYAQIVNAISSIKQDLATVKQLNAVQGNYTDITNIDLNTGDTTVEYDTELGIKVNAKGTLTHKNGATEQPTTKFEVPIIAGAGVSIDKKENEEKVEIKIATTITNELNKKVNTSDNFVKVFTIPNGARSGTLTADVKQKLCNPDGHNYYVYDDTSEMILKYSFNSDDEIIQYKAAYLQNYKAYEITMQILPSNGSWRRSQIIVQGVTANPNLTGTEEELTGLKVGGTNYKIPVINGKLNKPTTPSEESAVTMLADGTVGTKPLSEIAELGKLYQHTYTFDAGSSNYVYCTTYKNSSTPMTAEEVINFFKSDPSVGKVVNVCVVDNETPIGSGCFLDAGEGIDYTVIVLDSSAGFTINADTNMTTNIIEI